MYKKILVIGEVTRDQYQTPRIEMMREDHMPVVVRVQTVHFLMESQTLLGRYAKNSERQAYDVASKADAQLSDDDLLGGAEYRSTRIVHRLAARHIASFGSIDTLVFGEKAWIELSEPEYTYIAGVINTLPRCSIWVAYKNGTTQFVR